MLMKSLPFYILDTFHHSWKLTFLNDEKKLEDGFFRDKIVQDRIFEPIYQQVQFILDGGANSLESYPRDRISPIEQIKLYLFVN